MILEYSVLLTTINRSSRSPYCVLKTPTSDPTARWRAKCFVVCAVLVPLDKDVLHGAGMTNRTRCVVLPHYTKRVNRSGEAVGMSDSALVQPALHIFGVRQFFWLSDYERRRYPTMTS